MVVCVNKWLSPKDLIVLQLYLSFMQVSCHDEMSIYTQIIKLLKFPTPSEKFDPDLNFKFDQVNTDEIWTLLIGLNQDKFSNSEVCKLLLFDIFTNIIIEAL